MCHKTEVKSSCEVQKVKGQGLSHVQVQMEEIMCSEQVVMQIRSLGQTGFHISMLCHYFQTQDQPWVETCVFASVFASPVLPTNYHFYHNIQTEGENARHLNAD